MKKGLVILAAALTLVTAMPLASARHKAEDAPEKIIFIPHDNRPISDKQTADVVRKLGYDVISCPKIYTSSTIFSYWLCSISIGLIKSPTTNHLLSFIYLL